MIDSRKEDQARVKELKDEQVQLRRKIEAKQLEVMDTENEQSKQEGMHTRMFTNQVNGGPPTARGMY